MWTIIWNTAGIISLPCSSWGAKVFVLHGNKVPAASVNKDMYFTRFRRLAELGESYGVQVAQENVARCTSASLPFLLEMRDALGKQARFVLDIKQAVRSGEDPFAMLRGLNSHIVHVHISDHGEYGDCLPLGKGRFRFDAFLKELAAVSPDCSVILELYRSGFSDVAELAANYTLLRNRIEENVKAIPHKACAVLSERKELWCHELSILRAHGNPCAGFSSSR